jgi:vacuolar-type H+-ATPase catalytic subunit A/Vma1
MAKKKEFDIKSEIYLDDLFKKWEEKINLKVINDLMLVQKYKGELAKAFNEVKDQRNTMIGCMQEIIEKQEELLAIHRDLIKEITGKYPNTIGKITAEEYK